MAASDADGKWIARAVVLIAVLLAAVYLRAVDGPMPAGDTAVLVENAGMRGPGTALKLFVSGAPGRGDEGERYAPVAGISLATDRFLWGPSPAAWRITSLFLHGASCLLLFLVLMRLGLSGIIALPTTLLFALHPIHTQTIAVVSSRGHILAGAFTLAAVLFFARSLEAERPAWRRNAVPAGAWLSLGFFAAAIFSGIEALAFPLACLIWPWVAGRRYPHRYFYLGTAGIVVAYVVMMTAARVPIEPGRVLWGGAAVIKSLRLIVAPVGQMIVHPMRMPWSWGDGRFLAGIGIIAAFATASILTRGTRRPVPLMLAFMSCAVLGSLPAIAPHGALEEPGLYLMTAAACCAAAAVIDSLSRTRVLRGALTGMLVVCVAAAGLASSARCAVWNDMERVWLEVLDEHPDYEGAMENLAALYRRTGRSEKAAALLSPGEGDEYSRAVQLNNEGVALMDEGRLQGAAAKFSEAIKEREDFRDAHFNLGIVFHSLGLPDSSEVHFKRALEIDPFYANAHYNLGIVYDRAGDLDHAEVEYREAVRLDPSNARALANLGTLEGRRNHLDEAISLLERALEIDPGLLQARFNLALAYEKTDVARAKEEWKLYLDSARERGVDPATIAQVERRIEGL